MANTILPHGLRASRAAALLAVLALLAGCREGRAAPDGVRVPGGDARRGAAVIGARGCGACHTVPGVRGARGTVGPPLTAWSRRSYIAGRLANRPDNLIRWILDPQGIEPGTAMPDLDLTEQEGRDVAAYLYTLR